MDHFVYLSGSVWGAGGFLLEMMRDSPLGRRTCKKGISKGGSYEKAASAQEQ